MPREQTTRLIRGYARLDQGQQPSAADILAAWPSLAGSSSTGTTVPRVSGGVPARRSTRHRTGGFAGLQPPGNWPVMTWHDELLGYSSRRQRAAEEEAHIKKHDMGRPSVTTSTSLRSRGLRQYRQLASLVGFGTRGVPEACLLARSGRGIRLTGPAGVSLGRAWRCVGRRGQCIDTPGSRDRFARLQHCWWRPGARQTTRGGGGIGVWLA
jgi:hypothetical protein